MNAALRQSVQVLLGGRMLEHVDVHGRGDHQRGTGREGDRGHQVVGKTVGEPRDQMRRGRNRDEHLGPVGQFDVRNPGLLVRGEEFAAQRVAAQGLQRQRRDELERVRGGHNPNLVPAAHEQAHQIARLVGGNATRDAEQHATHARPQFAPAKVQLTKKPYLFQ